MTNEQETMADIIAEMRGHAKDGEFVGGYEVARLANRIEVEYWQVANKNRWLREVLRLTLAALYNRLPKHPTVEELETINAAERAVKEANDANA